MTRRTPKDKRLPAVGATERRSTALEAGANPTYGTVVAAGKRFRPEPDNTGDNSRDKAPVDEGERIFTHHKRAGEVRVSVRAYKGNRFLDVRWWATTRHGGFSPTHGGHIPCRCHWRSG